MLFRCVALAVAFNAAPMNALAQAPPRDQPAASATRGTGTIRGRVLAGDTGRPLRRVRITISAPELAGNNRTTSTDTSGRYEVTDLPAAEYSIAVRRSGYLMLRYGQTRPLEQPKLLRLENKAVADVDFTLPRMSLITGRVTDDAGDPIEGVTVMAMRARFWEGRRQLVPTGQGLVLTDDAGQYRILGLTPGTYYVMGTTQETWTVQEQGATVTMGFAPTYFPSVTSPGDARRITVGSGQEAGGTDFSMIPGRTATISGTALDSQGRPFPRNVALREEIRGENFGRFGGTMSSAVAADGSFAIRNVPPGDYQLVASTGRDVDRPEAAIVPVRVDGADVTGLQLVGSAGGTITGSVIGDDGTVPSLPQLRVTVGLPQIGQPDPTLLGTFGNPGSSLIAADGSFNVRGIFGRAVIRVALPSTWMVKTIMYDGRDIVDTPIDLKSGEILSNVKVTITNAIPIVAGQVKDDTGQALATATVVVFAEDDQRWGQESRAVRAVRPDKDGWYQVKGLPPGEYLAAAVGYVEDGGWNDPEFLQALRVNSQRVTVAGAGTQTISLTVKKSDVPR